MLKIMQTKSDKIQASFEVLTKLKLKMNLTIFPHHLPIGVSWLAE